MSKGIINGHNHTNLANFLRFLVKNIIHSFDYLYISMIYMSTRKRYLPFRDGQAARKGNLQCHPSLRDCDGTSPPQTAPEPQCQAAYAAVNVVPLFEQVSRPGSVRRGRLSTLRVRSPPLSSAPLLRPNGLRSIPLQSPAAPTTPDRLPGHAPLRSAPYGTARLLAATRKPLAHNPGDQETGQHHRPLACPSILRWC